MVYQWESTNGSGNLGFWVYKANNISVEAYSTSNSHPFIVSLRKRASHAKEHLREGETGCWKWLARSWETLNKLNWRMSESLIWWWTWKGFSHFFFPPTPPPDFFVMVLWTDKNSKVCATIFLTFTLCCAHPCVGCSNVGWWWWYWLCGWSATVSTN